MLFGLLHRLLSDSSATLPELKAMVPHPVLVASWIGILVTAFNLIPAGQLDGGRILYAISPKVHKWGTQLTIAALLYLGTVEWIGWLLFAFLLMLPAMQHPQLQDDSPLSVSQGTLAVLCIGIFVLCGTTQPCVKQSLMNVLLRIHWGTTLH